MTPAFSVLKNKNKCKTNSIGKKKKDTEFEDATHQGLKVMINLYQGDIIDTSMKWYGHYIPS